MRILELDYDTLSVGQFPNRELIRAWPNYKIWAAGDEQYMLVLVDSAKRTFIVFEYETGAERAGDIQLLQNLPDGDSGAGEGVPALLPRTPTGRLGRVALSLPLREDEILPGQQSSYGRG